MAKIFAVTLVPPTATVALDALHRRAWSVTCFTVLSPGNETNFGKILKMWGLFDSYVGLSRITLRIEHVPHPFP